MTIETSLFLPGVCVGQVTKALTRAGGKEIESGKLASPESSAALAVNSFGWFLDLPAELPPFPPLADLDWPAEKVEVERQMRFPWRGGRHPWLDAAVETATHLIGIESKRFEPFRDRKKVSLSKAYDRDVWGRDMQPICDMRDALRNGTVNFAHLDAAQLVKHAYGLLSEGRRIGKQPILLYLYGEPARRGSREIPLSMLESHRAEIGAFGQAVNGAAVRFAACSYREWFAGWTGRSRDHADAITASFQP
jgi:hypothetical protein